MDTTIMHTGFLHQRNIDGIRSDYLTDWQGHPLQSLYALRNRLTDADDDPDRPGVILLPGAFDPVKGEYGAGLIERLLTELRLRAVYEMHFRHRGICGRLDVSAILDDLDTMLGSRNGPSNIYVGLSGGAMMLAIALARTAERVGTPRCRGALLIGPHFPGYNTLFVSAVRRLFKGEEMLSKVARHAGHPHVPENVEQSLKWYETSAIKEKFNRIRGWSKPQPFPVPVQTLYFRMDTMNRRGRRKLSRMLASGELRPRLPGIHRGLYRVADSDARILDFCRRHMPAD